MGALDFSPVLLYVLAVVGLTWFVRQAATDWFERRGLTARRAVPLVLRGVAVVVVALVVANVALRQPPAALAFNLFVVAAQAGALLLTVRLAEAERVGRIGDGAP